MSSPSTTPEPDSELEKLFESYHQALECNQESGRWPKPCDCGSSELIVALKARDKRLKLEARIGELKRVILGYHSVTEVLNRIDQLEAEKEDKQ